MEIPACQPVREAKPETLVRRGDVVLTALNTGPEEVFKPLRLPRGRLAFLRPLSSVYEDGPYELWRSGLPLAPQYQARVKAWPAGIALRPGIELNPALGLERWEAERSLRGLLAEEPTYIALATYLLEEAQGFTLDLPGGIQVVVVRDSAYRSAVEIGEPIHLTEPPVLT